jgi:uncharacterized protein
VEPKKMTRRSFMLKGAAASLAAIGLTTGYSFFVERYWFQIKEVTLTLTRLPMEFAGLRLIQFSDVHLGRYFSLKRLEEITRKIELLQPDILCFTGDLFDAMNGNPSDKIIPILSKLKAPYGKFAVLGNHDHRSGSKTVTELLESCGFRVLINERDLVKRAGQHIQIVGVDEILYGRPDLSAALGDNAEQPFTLLLAHEPDYADYASGFPIDLQISGHSHGGQIRLPILGALFTPKYGQKYVQGLYKVKDSQLLVYTNRGIGTTQLPFRLFCRPELTVFTLQRLSL